MSKERQRRSTSGRKRRSVADAHGIRLHFLGAARAVTGSLHFFELNWDKESIWFFADCGSIQENSEQGSARADMKRLPPEFPWEKVAFGIVSHPHLDHVGDVPYAVKSGFTGLVYGTHACVDLTKILLPDSGYLQEAAAKRRTKKNERRCDEAEENGRTVRGCDEDEIQVEPRYTEAEARASLEQFRGVDYDKLYKVCDGVMIKFTHASHLLGAAVVTLELGTGASKRRVVFSGDLGRPDMPVLKDLAQVKHADVLICEGTYGPKVHPRRNRQEALAEVMKRALARASQCDPVTGYGVIIIAAFAMGRVPTILYDLKQIDIRNPVLLDSPMAIDGLDVYRRHPELYNAKAARLLAKGGDLFSPKRFAELRDWQDSVRLDEPAKEPIIIVGSSGMAVGGRIVRHLEQRLGAKNNTVIFIGYQAQSTLGRHLTTPGITEARIHGNIVPVRATIEHLHDYSGHADAQDILRWLRGFDSKPRKMFLVHGEEEALLALQELIKEELGWDVEVPRYRQIFDLD